jgi:hypothetical protein
MLATVSSCSSSSELAEPREEDGLLFAHLQQERWCSAAAAAATAAAAAAAAAAAERVPAAARAGALPPVKAPMQRPTACLAATWRWLRQ